MPPSRPSVDLIADEAAAREEAALDAYDSLASKAFVGLDELSEALMQLARETEKVPSSSRAQETRKAQTDDFLRSRGHRDRPASFEQFIEIYNDFVDFSFGRAESSPSGARFGIDNTANDDSPSMRRPPRVQTASEVTEESSVRVLSMANKVGERVNMARNSSFGNSPGLGEDSQRRGSLLGTMGGAPSASRRMYAVSASGTPRAHAYIFAFYSRDDSPYSLSSSPLFSFPSCAQPTRRSSTRPTPSRMATGGAVAALSVLAVRRLLCSTHPSLFAREYESTTWPHRLTVALRSSRTTSASRGQLLITAATI